MLTTDIAAADNAALQANPEAPVGWAWVLKRSAQLAAILLAGVLAACLLYAAASKADAGRGSASNPPAPAMKV